ncbi:MAG: hypothetical protein QGG42_17035 [Phycisphaerae bacterium]|nr:hypothetical protein [Phycisphaerae bacterium]
MLSKLRTFLLTLSAAAFICGCGISYSPRFRPAHTGAVPRTVVGVMIVYREALTLIDKLEYAAAAAKLEQVLGQFEAAEDIVHSAEAMFWLGFCREKLHRDDLARQTYVTVIQQFAGSTPAEYARMRLDAMNEN